MDKIKNVKGSNLVKLLSNKIYLDNSATTKTRKEVAKVINKYLKYTYGNPSATHRQGIVARGSIELAREKIASILNSNSNEIIFTGSGSEGNNTAIKGVVSKAGKDKHFITSRIEHSSILNTFKVLEKEGLRVTYINVDKIGRYDLKQLKNEIKADTALVSLSYVNNEIGTIQDVQAIAKIVKDTNALLHLDAVQALPYINIDLKKLNADMVTFSGHKLYAPKGIGILHIKAGTPVSELVSGGEQEFGLRSGTENVPYIMGLSKAIELNKKEKSEYVKKLTVLRDMIIHEVTTKIDGVILTGDPENRAPNNASFSFKGISGKNLVKKLSWHGIAASSASACSSPKNEPSHVLEACEVSEEYIHGSLRISLGKYNNKNQVRKLISILTDVVSDLRESKHEVTGGAAFISQQEFREKLDKKEKTQILDVRPFNYPNYKIAGAVQAPIWNLNKQIKKLDPKAETIVICNHGDIVAPEAQMLLMQKGFEKVRILKGGLDRFMNSTEVNNKSV